MIYIVADVRINLLGLNPRHTYLRVSPVELYSGLAGNVRWHRKGNMVNTTLSSNISLPVPSQFLLSGAAASFYLIAELAVTCHCTILSDFKLDGCAVILNNQMCIEQTLVDTVFTRQMELQGDWKES